MSATEKPACCKRLFQTWTWLISRPNGSPYSGLLPGLRIAPGDPGERIRIEQVREGSDDIGEISQPVLDRPETDIALQVDTEREVGRLASLERRLELARKLILGIEVELDLLAGLLLEGGDDLPDRRVLLRVVALLPPDHEVGGLGAEAAPGSAP